MAQEAARMSVVSYVFWTTIGFVFTLFKKVFIKPITYLKTPRHSVGVGYVTPIEETWNCIQFVFWYLYALATYPFIFVIHKSRLFYYRNMHPVYRDMLYSYDTRTGCSHWLPVNNGWVVKQSEWERDITIKPNSAFLMQSDDFVGSGNYYQFVIPYYYLEHFSLRKPVRREKVIIIKPE